MSRIQVKGLGSLNRKFDNLQRAFDGRRNFQYLAPIFKGGAKLISERAKQILLSRIRHRTGEKRLNPEEALVAKVFSKQRQGGFAAFGAWDYKVSRLGHMFERGTIKMAARPFLRPAIDTMRYAASKHIRVGLRRIIGRAAR